MNVETANEELIRQEELLPFLLNPNSYPHHPRRVRLVQTHSSFVFIAPPFVYKVKKPVNFGFLNFSTLEKRRFFCEREVALNRRLSSKVYLGVAPIFRTAEQFTFSEGGAIVEYAVKMRKLSDRYFVPNLLRQGSFGPEELDRIVEVLKSFYERQFPTEEIEAWGRIDRLKISTDENFRQTEPFIRQTLSQAAWETIRCYTEDFYVRGRSLFEERIRNRWIRDGHGDLHLEHIHVTPRAVNIYDCIEFNDRLRYVDVANDIAFLAMDLDYQGRRDLGTYFVKKMAGALGDARMGLLIDFYKCYRAYVRGKVESLHSIAHAAAETERKSSADAAGRYFRLALGYAIAGSEPLALAVMGRIASGKSTLATVLGAELGWPLFSSDHLRKQMAGFPLYERSCEAARSYLYSPEMTQQTYEKLLTLAENEVKQGRSVILDATFAKRAHRDQLKKRFASAGIRFQFLEAQAQDEDVKARLRRRDASPGELSDARLEDYQMLTRLYEPPTELSSRELLQVSTSGSVETTVIAALCKLVRFGDQSKCP